MRKGIVDINLIAEPFRAEIRERLTKSGAKPRCVQ
jgi:hypothetical protein